MIFLYLNSDKMGEGDPDLGRKLLLVFLQKLADSEDTQVDLVGCVNSGIFLTTTPNSPALESLRKLQSRGARIATCGTCLEHHARADQLQIGEVGSMDGTVEIMTKATKIIRP